MLGLYGPSTHAIDPAGLQRLLTQQLPCQTFENVKVPLHVVATDLMGGGTVQLSSGPLVDAVLASCAIPALFPPVLLGGRYLIVGVIASNTPISVAVALGAQRVIVHQLANEFERYRDQAHITIAPPRQRLPQALLAHLH